MIILFKIDEYNCSDEVTDMSFNENNLFIMHSKNPLHEYPKNIHILHVINLLYYVQLFRIRL